MAEFSSTPVVPAGGVSALPTSITPIASAIPAFIGYTPRADDHGISRVNRVTWIDSWAGFQAAFARLDATGVPLPEECQYPLRFDLTPAGPDEKADIGDAGRRGWKVRPDPATVYHLYAGVKLFFANGGGRCAVVSVGACNPAPSGPGVVATDATPRVVNPRVRAAELLAGLAAVGLEDEPTLLVLPDAVLLADSDYAAVCRAALAQAADARSRIVLLDVPTARPGKAEFMPVDIVPFRALLGPENLGWGAAYYPFLKANPDLVPVDFTAFGGSGVLAPLLENGPAVRQCLGLMRDFENPTPGRPTPGRAEIEAALRRASPVYTALTNFVLGERSNVVPPSAAAAGLIAAVDGQFGPAHAPANVSPTDVIDTTLSLTDEMQGALNVDPLSGKSINAFRVFPDRGVVLWGARTLDGNSEDWRYVSVRRVVIVLEQSIRRGLQAYAFQPNGPATWAAVAGMIDRFLTAQWTAGLLVGSTPAEAFSVAVGLGTSMTADDILNGVLRVNLTVAIAHPAEFLELVLEQRMQS
jgi:phage tail sheath protein FI